MTGRRVALVVPDVDGTLVPTDKVLPARTRAAVAGFAGHAIAFTIISSRPLFGMRMLIEPLDLRLPIAAFNGGVLAMPDLTVLARRRIGREAVRQALACFRSCDADVWLFTEDHWLLRNPDGAYVEHEVRTVQTQPVVVESFDRHLEQAVKMVGVSADFDRLAQCEARAKAALDAQATVARSQSYYLDITPPPVDKRVADRRDDRPFLGAGLLEIVELAVEQPRRHEMAMACGETMRDQIGVAFEIDNSYIRAVANDDVAVTTLQCRAGYDPLPALGAPAIDLCGDGLEPGEAIGIVQRDTAAHLGDVRGRMEIIGFGKAPAEAAGEERAHRRFAGSRNAHDDQHQRGRRAAALRPGPRHAQERAGSRCRVRASAACTISATERCT